MAEKRWKLGERKVAKALGGVRVPVSGRGDGPDIDHARYALEVKTRKRRSLLLDSAMAQAEKAAKGTSKVPMVVLHYYGDRFDDAYAVVRLRDVARVEGQ